MLEQDLHTERTPCNRTTIRNVARLTERCRSCALDPRAVTLLIQPPAQRLCPGTTNGTAPLAVDRHIGRPSARGSFISPVLVRFSPSYHPALSLLSSGASPARESWGLRSRSHPTTSRSPARIQRFSVMEVHSSRDVSIIRLGHVLGCDERVLMKGYRECSWWLDLGYCG
jgi:hypothetical protein